MGNIIIIFFFDFNKYTTIFPYLNTLFCKSLLPTVLYKILHKQYVHELPVTIF